MQAHGLSQAFGLRRKPGSSLSGLGYGGNCTVEREAFQRAVSTTKFYGLGISWFSCEGPICRGGTLRQTDRKLSPSLRKFGGAHLAKVHKYMSPPWLKEHESKERCNLFRNFRRKTLHKTRSVESQIFPNDLETAPSLMLEDVTTVDVASAECQWIRSMVTGIGISLVVLSAPGPVITESSFAFSNSAKAYQIGQIRQAGILLERAAEGLSKVRLDGVQVLDKALTVVSGSTLIDPERLDMEVEALITGQKDIREELKQSILDAMQGSWSTVVDVITNFNPVSLSESAGASITRFLEAGVERVAAFELSALVTLGERWLILTPLVLLPMAWKMNENRKTSDEESAREARDQIEKLSGPAQARGERVRRELERIELKAMLLDAVNSLGEMALQPPRTRGESGMIRRRIQDMLERLQQLNPVEEASIFMAEVGSSVAASTGSNDSPAYVPVSPTVDGDWRLIYVSGTTDNGGDQELPQLPGIALDNIRQKVWQTSSILPIIENDIPSPLLARNSAEIRFGPLGVVEIGVQGNSENLKNGSTALVSFDTFSARPLEIFGNKFREDIPELSLSIPKSLQQSTEWGVVYVDNHIRINCGRRGQLFLFSKVE